MGLKFTHAPERGGGSKIDLVPEAIEITGVIKRRTSSANVNECSLRQIIAHMVRILMNEERGKSTKFYREIRTPVRVQKHVEAESPTAFVCVPTIDVASLIKCLVVLAAVVQVWRPKRNDLSD